MRAYTRAIARRELIAILVVLAFLGAAAFEAAVALEWIHMGRAPGEEASGQLAATAAAILGVLAGIGLAVTGVATERLNRPAALVPLTVVAIGIGK